VQKLTLLLIEVRGTNLYLHNGLAYLAGALKNRGSVEIIDLNYLDWSEEQLIDYVRKANPQIIGFSVKSTNVAKIINLIKEIKPLVNSLIIVGGAHVSLLGKEFLEKNPEIDYGLQCEAERTMADFLDYLEGKKKVEEVSGLIYRKDQLCFTNPYSFNYNLDEINFPDYQAFRGVDVIKYFKKNSYPLLTSRGCPYNCIYCSVKNISGRAWRPRSVENIIQELIEARERYQLKNFEIVDDNFTMDIRRALNFCQELIKHNLNLNWGCPNGIRADRITNELARNMQASGCHYVSIGIESGDEEVFNNIKKGETLEDIVKATKILMKNKIKVAGFFIIGLPFDNLKKTKKTIKFINQLNLNGGVKWNFLIPYPKTELWDWVRIHGHSLTDFTKGRHFFKNEAKIVPTFETPDFTAKQRIKAWKIANLATSSYAYVFKIPKSKILYKLKIFFYLLYYSPDLLLRKILRKILNENSLFKR